MKKFLSFEHTFTKQEIEKILLDHTHKKLMAEDKDYKASLFAKTDFTYRKRDDGSVDIDLIILCDYIKMRKP